jgi:hypothetical protein
MKNTPPFSATELVGEEFVFPPPLGRKLTLKFIGTARPQLELAEFTCEDSARPGYWLQKAKDGDHSITWTKVPQAVSLLFLDYVSAGLQGSADRLRFLGSRTGSLAASLGDAIDKREGKLYKLFALFPKNGGEFSRVQYVFDGINVDGGKEGERCLWVKTDYLPFECVEIFWDTSGPGPIKRRSEIQKLADQIRKAERLPPVCQLKLPEGEAGQPKSEPAPPAQPEPEVLQKEISISAGGIHEPKTVAQSEPARFPPPAPPPKIAPRLFQIHNPKDLEWDDFAPLINFGHPGNDADVWRIRDATEGVAIFGAVGSGKTSGSGALIAQAYLQAGFGGLVLTAKPDEARRWLRLCQRSGRAADCIHVTPDSGHKLNLLQYESQRPGKRISVTDDLIALLRCLIAAMSRGGQGKGFSNDEFWTNATNQLTRKLFDLFQLADEPLTIHGLVHFVNIAPTNASKPWQTIPYFTDLINRAEHRARKGSDVDKRIFSEVFDYWTSFYPHKVPAVTRGGFLTAFTAMADVLTGRGIYEIIGLGTNLTPEMILSGKIVILDFPMKQNVKGGFMVQAAFKLLFQQAVERRADKGLPSARPVFLWEDEAHLFFSSHDVDFQPTARDCRVSHVTLSQNLHNFMQHGHNEHDMFAVFASMNTNIFHTNGDLETNRWASERIGMERTETLKGSGLKRPVSDDNISFFKRQRPEDFKNVGGVKWESDKQPAFPPEDFAKLKRGGDGTCEAVILWLSHQFAANQSKNFRLQTFTQEQR